MATAAQIEANRKNAASSTGAKTSQGKSRSSQNHLKFGLFSTENCVQPHETKEYAAVSQSLWKGLSPASPVEELLATEIVRASWRLRRCALVEASFAARPAAEGSGAPQLLTEVVPPCDPMLDQRFAAAHAAVDRVRAQAHTALCRFLDELRRLQTDRWLRSETLPDEFDHAVFGLADTQHVMAGLAINERWQSSFARMAIESPAVPVRQTGDQAAVPPEPLRPPAAAGPGLSI